MNLETYIKNKEINIAEDDWINLKEQYTKDELVDELSNLIIQDKIDMPMQYITLEDVIEMQKELMELDTQIKHGKFYTRYEEDNLSDFYFDENSKYNIVSNYFHQYNRFMCDSINSPSPYRVFHNKKFASSMLSALFTLRCKSVDTKALYSCIALRKYIASQFKPAVAKVIYDYFGAKNVVDPCAGWGDRLAGFYASSAESYFGIDANSSLQDGYKQQIKLYNNIKPKEANIIYGASEDVEFPECDFVFTSPPYFRVERYSKDTTQSYLRYKKLQDWLDKFLFVVINKSYNSLENKGYLVLNISDVYMNHTINHICHPMIDYAESIGFKLTDIFGMRMSKRVNSKSDKNGIFCEPIYVFQKSC